MAIFDFVLYSTRKLQLIFSDIYKILFGKNAQKPTKKK
jgi:hypothetical protein